MRRKPLFWFLLSLLCLGGAWYSWQLGDRWEAERAAAHTPAPASTPQSNATPPSAPHATAPGLKSSAAAAASALAAMPVDPRYPFRLRNTTQSVSNLVHNQKAILLANALIDTGNPVNLTMPDRLRAPAGNGTYIVQSRTALNDQFRAMLNEAGAVIVSYIPNNAYLVRVSDSGAAQLLANAQTQSVLPFEPYYKLDAPVLQQVMQDPDTRAPGGGLKVLLFGDAYQATLSELTALGAEVVSAENSPFGPVLTVHPQKGTLPELASLPGVQGVSAAHARQLANDLVRPRLNVAADSITPTNYLGLTGSNVLININDTGVDAAHPDLAGRIVGAVRDDQGHGTHVAGTILGSGFESGTLTNPPPGSVTNANFRGIATNATAFVIQLDSFLGTTEIVTGAGSISDGDLQQEAAAVGAMISNDSWNYNGAASYDIAAASYDAAVRDALPGVTGPQPLVYVFSAGNDGGGDGNGGGQAADTILSPATAKNVITVGMIEQPRFITVTNTSMNEDGTTNSTTNTLFLGATDSDDQVAAGSSCGNVGIDVEGSAGRFKPDLVSPGTFVVSTRSTTWAQVPYYDPTNATPSLFVNEVVASNSLDGFPPIFLPDNIVGLSLTLSTNRLSPNPLPVGSMAIYAQVNKAPTAKVFAAVSTNGTLTVPANLLTPGKSIFFSVGNTSTQSISFNATITMLTTNDNGYFLSLSNLNSGVAPFYRYETGTSMAAAGVTGMLALLEEFFHGAKITPSPALLKAMLINGARPLPAYDLEVATPLNAQGWGLPNLPNTIPEALTNLLADGMSTMPVQFFDQSPTNALATGQSFTRNITLTPDAQGQDLRITLVWTDPPGNPAAGVKLVNDLDLIVTNLDTGGVEVFYGNDIPGGSDFNESADPTVPPNVDSVNNVENVFLQAPLGTNYSITVLGRRVNVNAVTANTNNIVQDYALVISSGDAGAVSSPFTINNANSGLIVTNNPAVSNLTVVSNGIPLFNQRVGANSQYSGSTNGTAAQWNFYVFTNTAAMTNGNFTNVAILTFVPPDVSLPRMEALTEISPPDEGATRYTGADIDLYVSTNPALTNLDTNVIAAAFKSTTRTGTEKVLLTNSFGGQVFYIGVKSEDQEAAQFALFGVATDQPFDQTAANGNTTVTMLTSFPVVIPPGGPQNPGHGLLLGVTTSSQLIRKVVVTNTVQHQEFGDLIGTLTHGTKTAVLNNHSFFTNVNDQQETLVYDDSGENDIPGARKSDGPGTLQNFTGDTASSGVWMFTMVNDSSLTDTGQVQNFVVYLEPQSGSNIFNVTINPGSFFFDFVDVPADATNLTISLTGNTAPLDLVVRNGDFPSLTVFDDFAALPPGGGALSISKFSSPPLNAGRYFYGIFNPGTTPQTVTVTIEVDQSLTPVATKEFLSAGSEALLDDAVYYSTNHVGIDSRVVSAEVGVRINHARESDLTLTLISPSGTRVLLAENRGGLDTNGYGSGMNVTNVQPTTASGGPAVNTNIITLTNGATTGTLIINYQFFTEPDQMRIYYDGALILDTGLISGSGTLSVNFGPGSSSFVEITMNELGNSSQTTVWNYTATVVTSDTAYAIFSENTNLATIPIKFATPPFGAGEAFLPPATNFISSFEGIPAGDYSSGSPAGVDGWTVLDTNPVTVVTVPALADTGSNVLALHGGSITRTFPTVAGENYTLTYVYHGRPPATPSPAVAPAGWWKARANNDFSDYSDNNNTANPALSPSGGVSFAPGVVDDAFDFDGNHSLIVNDSPTLALTNAMTIEGWVLTHDGQTRTIIERGDDQPQLDPYALGVGPSTVGGPVELQWQVTDKNNSATVLVGAMSLDVFTHVAGTYSFDGTNGHMAMYINGQLTATNATAVQPIGALTGPNPGVSIGKVIDGSPFTFYWDGLIDELTVHSNELSAVQVQDIYAAGSAGKDPVGATPPVTATVILGNQTNTISGVDQWITNVFAFTAVTNSMTLTIRPDENTDGFGGTVRDGMLFDSFTLIKNGAPNPTNYFLPEESLDKLVGEPSEGDWLLEVLDDRAGATNGSPMLVSWELNLVLADTAPAAIPINPTIGQTNTVQPNSIVYYVVNVPLWAKFATNILATTNAVNLLFNQTILPSTNLTDFTLINGQPGGTVTLNTTNGPPALPLLVPGQRYFLGVQNLSSNTPVNFTLEVDFDITPLTNATPLTAVIAPGNVPRYFEFDVDSNAVATLFQIVSTSGNVELVVNQGPPLPDTVNFDFLSFGGIPQTIAVPTNALVVPPLPPLPMGTNRWYFGVFNEDNTNVTYTIMATEAGTPNIISLTNLVPYTFTNAPPGPALTNFYSYNLTNTNSVALFVQLTHLNGDVDLDGDSGALPYAEPFLVSSSNPGTSDELVVIRTNGIVTNLMADWYFGVPNNTTNNVTYTITATEAGPPNIITLTNGMPYTFTNSPPGPALTNFYVYHFTNANSAGLFVELTQLSGNVDLDADAGTLPYLPPFTFSSAKPGTNDEQIFIRTNGSVSSLLGDWFFGVPNNTTNNVTYTITATEAGPPNIITLTNGVAYTFVNTPPGPVLSNFYEFSITSPTSAVLFELYNLTGNVDLDLDDGTLPYSSPFFASSTQPGTNDEQIVIRTNGIATRLASTLVANWFLGVPNNAPGNVTYTIRATVATNGLLISTQGINVQASVPTSGSSTGPTLKWVSVLGECYEVQESSDLFHWTTITTVPGTGTSTSFTDPAPVSGNRFYRIVQVPGPC